MLTFQIGLLSNNIIMGAEKMYQHKCVQIYHVMNQYPHSRRGRAN